MFRGLGFTYEVFRVQGLLPLGKALQGLGFEAQGLSVFSGGSLGGFGRAFRVGVSGV